MFYSNTLEDHKLNLFLVFLKSLLNGEERYKEEVNYVISETIQLAKGEKDFYSINRDRFSVILHLKKSDPAFFENLDVKKMGNDEYEHITQIFDQQSNINLV